MIGLDGLIGWTGSPAAMVVVGVTGPAAGETRRGVTISGLESGVQDLARRVAAGGAADGSEHAKSDAVAETAPLEIEAARAAVDGEVRALDQMPSKHAANERAKVGGRDPIRHQPLEHELFDPARAGSPTP